MQFLTPAAIALAAALTIPPLLLLYFLKLKRTAYPVSSTLLWRRAIEDLHVNAPFQRLRSSLLLLLQLLVLILAALALGQPMFAHEKDREQTLILIIDQSASMAVIERDGMTRLDIAKREAKRVVDGMDEHTRAMVIALCDRATMVSSFDTDRDALKRKIDSIEQTDSVTMLEEAIGLAEAYSQNLIIGTSAGTDVAPESAAPRASVILFTDGRIADASTVAPQRIDLSHMEVVTIGERSDNVGIVSMDARRTYERQEMLQVFATVRNFGPSAVSFDATLFINDEHIDIQSVELAPGVVSGASGPSNETAIDPDAPDREADSAPPPGSVAAIAFDEVEFEGRGIVEVRLTVRDALQADNKAWAIIQPARRVDVLLVTDGNFVLERALTHINASSTRMTPEEYESAPDEDIIEGKRARYDVVIFDRHDTGRLPLGSYLFWAGVPEIDGVERIGLVDDEVIIDWDENHPVLRHVLVSNLNIFFHWQRLKLPGDAVHLIEGETANSNVLSYFTRGGSRFLICTFPLFVTLDDDAEPVLNTDWFTRWDFVTFLYDTVEFLASSRPGGTLGSLRPGDPETVAIPDRTDSVTVKRPDRTLDRIPTGGATSVTYARTRRVGTYEVQPAADGAAHFAVNLFDPAESQIAPKNVVVLGSSPIPTTQGKNLVNDPLWSWLLLALLVVVVLEWIIYNKRVFV